MIPVCPLPEPQLVRPKRLRRTFRLFHFSESTRMKLHCAKTISLLAIALYLTYCWVSPIVFAQPTELRDFRIAEIEHRLQALRPEERFAVLEQVSQQHSEKLSSIESLLRTLALGIATLVGELVIRGLMHVKGYVTRKSGEG